MQAVAPKGVDIVVDLVGGAQFEESLKVVSWGAQILIIGFASGTIPKVMPLISLYTLFSFHMPCLASGGFCPLTDWHLAHTSSPSPSFLPR